GVLSLPVCVRVTRIGRPARNPHREQGKQCRHEIGPGVDRLGDEPEAPTRESGAELERDERDRGKHGDERGSSLRGHVTNSSRPKGTIEPWGSAPCFWREGSLLPPLSSGGDQTAGEGSAVARVRVGNRATVRRPRRVDSA